MYILYQNFILSLMMTKWTKLIKISPVFHDHWIILASLVFIYMLLW